MNMERLTTRWCPKGYDTFDPIDIVDNEYSRTNYEKLLDKLGEYEDLEEQGLLLRLPDIRDMLDEQPTIEAVPVVYGFNDNRNYHECDEFRCSECGLHLEDWSRHVYEDGEEIIKEYVFKYCPECGAMMKGGE